MLPLFAEGWPSPVPLLKIALPGTYPERGPSDDLRLQFEAVGEFSEEEKQTVRELLEGLILKHQARRWSTRTTAQKTVPDWGRGRATKEARAMSASTLIAR